MNNPEEKIIGLSKKLMAIRRNPILILDLKEIEANICLKLQKKLFAQKFEILDVILQTPGGDINAAYNNVKLLRYSSFRRQTLCTG